MRFFDLALEKPGGFNCILLCEIYEYCIVSSWGCVGVGRLWDINRSWFQRPLLTRLYVRASIQLSLSHCSLVTGWSALPCDLGFWEILKQAVHMWWYLKSDLLGEGDYRRLVSFGSCSLCVLFFWRRWNPCLGGDLLIHRRKVLSDSLKDRADLISWS